MPLAMRMNVCFAWDTETYAKLLLFPFSTYYDRWKGLEPRLYQFQNTDDKLAWLLANAKLLVSIFSGDQELPCQVSLRESSLVVI